MKQVVGGWALVVAAAAISVVGFVARPSEPRLAYEQQANVAALVVAAEGRWDAVTEIEAALVAGRGDRNRMLFDSPAGTPVVARYTVDATPETERAAARVVELNAAIGAAVDDDGVVVDADGLRTLVGELRSEDLTTLLVEAQVAEHDEVERLAFAARVVPPLQWLLPTLALLGAWLLCRRAVPLLNPANRMHPWTPRVVGVLAAVAIVGAAIHVSVLAPR